MDADNKKPFKIKDVTRNIKKAVVAATLEEIRTKIAEKFEKTEQQLPTIHLDSDGTEIDDEEYFRTLDENTELIAVFPGEHWIDPTHYVTITSQRDPSDTTDAAQDTARIQQLVGQLQNNLCNVSVISDPDLDSLSNMDPNSLVDITGKDFMEQLKDSGRPLCAKRTAEDRINLLKLLKEGAIFCSERYPEDAEDIDLEISRQMNAATSPLPTAAAATTTNTTNTTESETTKANLTGKTKTITTQTTTITRTAVNMETQENNVTETIEQVQNMNVEQVIINNDANAVSAAATDDAKTMLASVTEITVITAAATATTAAATAAVNTRGKNKTNDI